MQPNPGFSLVFGWTRIQSLLRDGRLWVGSCSVWSYSARRQNVVRDWPPDVVQIEYHVMAQYLSALDGRLAPHLLNQHEPGTPAARDLWQSSRCIASDSLF